MEVATKIILRKSSKRITNQEVLAFHRPNPTMPLVRSRFWYWCFAVDVNDSAAIVVALHPSIDPLDCRHYYCSLPFDDSAFVIAVDLVPSYRPHQTQLVCMAYYLMLSCRPYFLNYPIARTALVNENWNEKRKKMRQIIGKRVWNQYTIIQIENVHSNDFQPNHGSIRLTEAVESIIKNSRHARARDLTMIVISVTLLKNCAPNKRVNWILIECLCVHRVGEMRRTHQQQQL